MDVASRVASRNRSTRCCFGYHPVPVQRDSNLHYHDLPVSLLSTAAVIDLEFTEVPALFSSTGITSRGRIGIDAALTGRALKEPWFTDPVDKESLITGINEIISSIKNGKL